MLLPFTTTNQEPIFINPLDVVSVEPCEDVVGHQAAQGATKQGTSSRGASSTAVINLRPGDGGFNYHVQGTVLEVAGQLNQGLTQGWVSNQQNPQSPSGPKAPGSPTGALSPS